MGSTKIESVAERQRGSYDFATHYNNLCALQSTCPLPAVKAHLDQRVLDINGDRIRAQDWLPIIGTLRINKTLQSVAVRSYFQQTIEEQEGRNYKRKTPAIRSKEITYRLCKSLKECLLVSPILTVIELQGLPLREKDMAALAKGIHQNRVLTHLSLEHCRIGDAGLEVIAKGLRGSHSVGFINLSGCSLTSKGAEVIANLMKHQAMMRHNEAWQDSLRYRRPDLDRMDGIRRISVNGNPMMGDMAAKLFADALKDDLWVKALDMQQCGISDEGANALLDTLEFNNCIVVLDIRQNPMTKHELIKKVIETLTVNSAGFESDFKWIKAEPLQDPAKVKNKKRRTKALPSNFGKRATVRVSNSNTAVTSSRRKSKGGTPTRAMYPMVGNEGTPGLPWRTALRANRFKGYPPEESPSNEKGVDVSIVRGAHTSVHISTRNPAAAENSSDGTPNSTMALRGNFTDTDNTSSDVKDLKAAQVEIEMLRRRLRDEKRARARGDEQIINLTLQNSQLKQEVDDYRARQSILDDDAVLDSIEKSFQQFHQFMELLRDAGLGQLITLAGIDPSTVPFAAPTTSKSDTAAMNGGRRARSSAPGYHPPPPPHRPHQSKSASSPSPTPPAAAPAAPAEPVFSDTFQAMVRQANAGRGDPTLNAPIPTAQPQHNKFDDLYSKVLRETEGALQQHPDKSDHEEEHSKASSRMSKGSRASKASSGNLQRPLNIEDLQPASSYQQNNDEDDEEIAEDIAEDISEHSF